jgi:hypothetical protein
MGKILSWAFFLGAWQLDGRIAVERLITVYQSGGWKPRVPGDFLSISCGALIFVGCGKGDFLVIFSAFPGKS